MATGIMSGQVYHDWEALHDKRFQMIEDAIRRRDMHMLSAMEVQDSLSGVDWQATFTEQVQALESHDQVQTNVLLGEMRGRFEEANVSTKTQCEEIHYKMDGLASSDKATSPDAWEAELDKDFALLETKTIATIRETRDWSKAKIREMPPEVRDTAAKAVGTGANALGRFLGQAVDWLKTALDSVWLWVKEAWKKIQEFASSVVDWAKTAWNTISAAFSWFSYFDLTPRASSAQKAPTKAFTGARQAGSMGRSIRSAYGQKGVSHHSQVEDIVPKLQKAGLDSFTFVRKGPQWVIELK